MHLDGRLHQIFPITQEGGAVQENEFLHSPFYVSNS